MAGRDDASRRRFADFDKHARYEWSANQVMHSPSLQLRSHAADPKGSESVRVMLMRTRCTCTSSLDLRTVERLHSLQ